MRENPKPFEVYRHFKGNMYQIMSLATDSEDEKPVVVYQALYGEYKIYVRALDSFMSLVDKEKYPYVQQTYRFEKVTLGQPEPVLVQNAAESKEMSSSGSPIRSVVEPQPVETPRESQELDLDPLVLEYLDASTYEERINILASAHHRINDDMIDVMAACSDIEVEKGPIEERYQSLKNCLITKQKFEKVRLF